MRRRERFHPPVESCLSCRQVENRVQAISSKLTEPGPAGTYTLTRDELIDLISDVVQSM